MICHVQLQSRGRDNLTSFCETTGTVSVKKYRGLLRRAEGKGYAADPKAQEVCPWEDRMSRLAERIATINLIERQEPGNGGYDLGVSALLAAQKETREC